MEVSIPHNATEVVSDAGVLVLFLAWPWSPENDWNKSALAK
jgi:hypothetical protein